MEAPVDVNPNYQIHRFSPGYSPTGHRPFSTLEEFALLELLNYDLRNIRTTFLSEYPAHYESVFFKLRSIFEDDGLVQPSFSDCCLEWKDAVLARVESRSKMWADIIRVTFRYSVWNYMFNPNSELSEDTLRDSLSGCGAPYLLTFMRNRNPEGIFHVLRIWQDMSIGQEQFLEIGGCFNFGGHAVFIDLIFERIGFAMTREIYDKAVNIGCHHYFLSKCLDLLQ